MTARLPPRAGFTLIELLVAIGILAIIAVLGWRGLDSIVRARVALTGQMEATRGMQLAFAQMQSDAEHIASPALLQNRPALMAQAEGMTLVRNVYNENEPTRLQVISYRVHNRQLERRESLATRDLMQIDIMWRAATGDTDTTPPVVLQVGVTGISVQTWENKKWVTAGQSAGSQGASQGAGQGSGQGSGQGAGQGGLGPTSQTGQQNGPQTPTGLQVAIQLQGVEALMVKNFLLGGV